MRRVVITGIGLVSPMGCDVEKVFNSRKLRVENLVSIDVD